MPPKADPKKDDKKPKKESGPTPVEPINEQSKEFYLAQIRDLENRIDR